VRERVLRTEPESAEERPPAPAPAAPSAILDLQRSAGNAAVSAMLARAPTATEAETPLAKLRKLLQDDDEAGAISQFASLTPADAGTALADSGLRDLAVKAFDDEQMGRAMQSIKPGVRLLQKLNWMSVEGSSFWLVWPLLIHRDVPAAEKTELYGQRFMRDFFVDICDDDQMATVVRTLGGTLAQKLDWMLAEGTSWKAVRPMIADPAVDAPQRLKLYEGTDFRDKLTGMLNTAEVLDLVHLLGGTLSQRLNWLWVKGTNWRTVKPMLADPAVPAAEKLALYGQAWALELFTDICGNDEMADAVGIIGGKPDQKLRWMIEEGTDARAVYHVAQVTPDADLLRGGLPHDVTAGLRGALSGKEFQRAEQMLTRGLLNWDEIDSSRTESHYELKDAHDPTQGYKLEDFDVQSKYEIDYSRTELRVKVRIRFTGERATPAHIAVWQNGIAAKWNGAFHVENGRRIPIVFEPVWNASSAHHDIELHKPPVVREDAANWYAGPAVNTAPGATQDTTDANTAAHEFGHLIGLADEYNLTAADYQRITSTPPPAGPAPASGYTTTSVMGTITGPVEGRHMRPFVDWLNRHRVPGERPYRVVAGP
jgi:hypothetical protein